MDINLTGKRIIVTGGTEGIGGHAADYYLASGAKVVSLDVKDSGRAPNPNLLELKCDVSDRERVISCFEQGVVFLGGLDALCHVAGITRRSLAEEITPDQMREVFEINVMGTLHTNQQAWRFMHEKGGSIINFTSAASIRGLRNEAHYASTKGAVAGWTRAVALDWGKYNIRVNAIAPMALTPIAQVSLAFIPEDQREAAVKAWHSAQSLPGGLRDGAAIAPLLAFLASDASSYMTGQTLSIDGGVVMLGS